MATISWPGDEITGLHLEYETYNQSIRSRVNVHELLGGGEAFTVTASGGARRTLTIVTPDEPTALRLLAAASAGHQLTVLDPVRPSLNATYQPIDNFRLTLDEDTLDDWVIEIDVIEVTA